MCKIQDKKSVLVAALAFEAKTLAPVWCGIRIVDTDVNVVRVRSNETLRCSAILVDKFHKTVGWVCSSIEIEFRKEVCWRIAVLNNSVRCVRDRCEKSDRDNRELHV